MFYRIHRPNPRQRAELEAVKRNVKIELDSALLLWYRLGMPTSHKDKIKALGFTYNEVNQALQVYGEEATG